MLSLYPISVLAISCLPVGNHWCNDFVGATGGLKQLLMWSYVSAHRRSKDLRSSGCAWGNEGSGPSFPGVGHHSLVITVVQMLWGMGNCCILLKTRNWNNNRIKGSLIVKRLWSCITWFHIFSFKISGFQTSLWFYSVPLTLWYYTGVYFTWQILWNVDYVIRK